MGDFADELNSAIDDLKQELSDRLSAIIEDEVKKLTDVTELIKLVDIPGLVRRTIYEHFRECVANEIGNRLRCGIYDGTRVDKLFDSAWTDELEKALQDRIHRKADKAIDAAIANRLKQMTKEV